MYCSILLFIILSTLSFLASVTDGSEDQGFQNAQLRNYDASDLTIRLEDYPNYSMKLDLGATSEHSDSNRNVSITLIPPKDHGILIIVQYPRDSYESQSRSLQQAYRYFTSDMKILVNNGQTLCLDYLLLLNMAAGAETPVLVQSCAYLSSSYDQRYIRNYFKGVEYYANDANQEINLLRITAANPNEGHSLKPSLIITSYVVCSNFEEAVKRSLYKICSPSGAGPSLQQQNDGTTSMSPFCIPTKLFCDGNSNCIHREDHNGSETAVVVGADEADCKTTSAIAFSPLFPIKAPTTRTPIITTPTPPSDDTPDTGTPTGKTTTKRPWWKPIIPPWSWPGSDSKTTTEPPQLTTTTTSRPHLPFGHQDDNIRTPWYSPTSPFGTVIIFAAVVILVFGVCSFLAKVHSTRRPVYGGNRDSSESPNIDRPFSAESNSFARQLIEMIEEEELRNNSPDRRTRPAPTHGDSTGADFNVEDYVRSIAPPPRYIDDVLPPAYDSLFENGNRSNDNKNGPPPSENNR